MSGYRESSFDPNTPGEVLPPPPTWLQRIGIACLFVGAAVTFAYIGGQWGLIPKWIRSPVLGTIIVVMAGPLIGAGARRGPLSEAGKRRQIIIIGTAIAVCAVAATLTFYFKGA